MLNHLTTIEEIERAALERLPLDIRQYYAGGSGTESSLRRNKFAFDRFQLLISACSFHYRPFLLRSFAQRSARSALDHRLKEIISAVICITVKPGFSLWLGDLVLLYDKVNHTQSYKLNHAKYFHQLYAKYSILWRVKKKEIKRVSEFIQLLS